jgi:hypothetical protein
MILVSDLVHAAHITVGNYTVFSLHTIQACLWPDNEILTHNLHPLNIIEIQLTRFLRTVVLRRIFWVESKGFWLVSNTQNHWVCALYLSDILNNYKTQLFGNWICFRVQIRRVIVAQWLRLASSKGPNRIVVFHPSPEDGNIQFPKLCIFCVFGFPYDGQIPQNQWF